MLTLAFIFTLLAIICFVAAAMGPPAWYPQKDRDRMIALGLALLALAGIV